MQPNLSAGGVARTPSSPSRFHLHLVLLLACGVWLGIALPASGQPRAEEPAKKAEPTTKPPALRRVLNLGTAPMRHEGSVRCLVFSPDGKRLASGGEDGLVRIWDTTRGTCAQAELHSAQNPAHRRTYLERCDRRTQRLSLRREPTSH